MADSAVAVQEGVVVVGREAGVRAVGLEVAVAVTVLKAVAETVAEGMAEARVQVARAACSYGRPASCCSSRAPR